MFSVEKLLQSDILKTFDAQIIFEKEISEFPIEQFKKMAKEIPQIEEDINKILQNPKAAEKKLRQDMEKEMKAIKHLKDRFEVDISSRRKIFGYLVQQRDLAANIAIVNARPLKNDEYLDDIFIVQALMQYLFYNLRYYGYLKNEK